MRKAASRCSRGAPPPRGMRGTVLRSDDDGRHWARADTGAAPSFFGALQRRDGAIVLVGQGGAVYESSDGGRRFVPKRAGGRLSLTSVAATANGALLFAG